VRERILNVGFQTGTKSAGETILEGAGEASLSERRAALNNSGLAEPYSASRQVSQFTHRIAAKIDLNRRSDSGPITVPQGSKQALWIHALVHAYQRSDIRSGNDGGTQDHGYRIGPGTMYPLLRGMERGGLMKSEFRNDNGRRRRVYRITASGKRALDKAREKVDELHHELHVERPRNVSELTSS
jgi:PadR family transcriptional regulator PadR